MILSADWASSLVNAGISVYAATEAEKEGVGERRYIRGQTSQARTDLSNMETAAAGIAAQNAEIRKKYGKVQNVAGYVALGTGALLLIYGALQ